MPTIGRGLETSLYVDQLDLSYPGANDVWFTFETWRRQQSIDNAVLSSSTRRSPTSAARNAEPEKNDVAIIDCPDVRFTVKRCLNIPKTITS